MFVGRALIRRNVCQRLPGSTLCNAERASASRPFARAFVTPSTTTAAVNHIHELAEKLRSSSDLYVIRSSYQPLIQEIRKAKLLAPIVPPLRAEDIRHILQALAVSGRPEDVQQVNEVLHDLTPVLDIQPSLDLYTAVIEGLTECGNLQTLLKWLAEMPKLPGHFTPTLHHFHLVLERCSKVASFDVVRNLVFDMPRYGCRPSTETINVLVRALWEISQREGQVPTVGEFALLMDDIERFGLPWNPQTSALLFESYIRVGLLSSGEKVRNLYNTRFVGGEAGSSAWSTTLSLKAQSGGVAEAISLFKELEKEGCRVSRPIIGSILRHSRSVDDLRLVETELGVKCDVGQWTRVISNCTRSNLMDDALKLYQESRNAGIRPDAGLIAPLLRGLWKMALQSDSDAPVEQALALYRDLSEAAPVQRERRDNKRIRHSRGPDLDIYQSIFRLLSKSNDISKYHSVALSLLEDMKARDISTNVSSIAASIIVLSMRLSPNAAEALDAYRAYRSSLDEEGYGVVLAQFSKLQFGAYQLPTIQDYFSIVNDMRRAGHPITSKVYTTLLLQMASLAIKMKYAGIQNPDLQELLITSTRRTHDLLSLDASFSPDAALWNQMISTYQRLGCFADAYRVWQLMYLTGTFDSVSISNILDGCGYANDLQTAKNVWSRVSRDGFSLDLHNWNTWVECLCRCGQLNWALKTIQDMQADGVAPDLTTISVLIKFGRKAKQEERVRSYLEHTVPSLYNSLPDKVKDID